MKYSVYVIAANLASIICIIFGGILCFKGIEGWGWFLFIGLLCTSSVKFSDDKKNGKEDTDG